MAEPNFHFPVLFFDGEREINIGNVKLHPSIEFKSLQSMISHKIGVSANQITIYLIDRKKSKLDEHRKIMITGKTSFFAICREKDCLFLVVLKRSRRERRRKVKQSNVEFSDYLPQNLMLLRRNEIESPYYSQIERIQRENYISMITNPRIEDIYAVSTEKTSNWNPILCGECMNAKITGETPSFHLCVYDSVTVGFRSPAGPISRPYR